MLGKPPQQLLCSLLYSLTCVAGTAFSIPPQQAEAGAVFWKASQWVGWKPKLHVFMRSPQELRNQNHFQFIWSKSKLGGTLNSNSQFRKKRFLQEVLEESLSAITVAARQRKGLLLVCEKLEFQAVPILHHSCNHLRILDVNAHQTQQHFRTLGEDRHSPWVLRSSSHNSPPASRKRPHLNF